MDVNTIIPQLKEWAAFYGLNIIAAILIFVIGRWVAKVLRKLIRKLLEKSKVDASIIPFVTNLAYVLMLTVVVIAALSKLGIQTASLIAIIGAAGLAVALALQGSLANFAAGVLVLIFRPFKVGDYIEAAGIAGSVEKIEIFTTTLKTPDNRVIIIPNAKLSGDIIINYTAEKTRRLDLVFGVSYGDDLQKVKKVLLDILAAEPRVLKEPAPMVAIVELADSSVNFAVRPWIKSADYWDLFFALRETVKKRFDEEGITIPFPQQDVHMYEMKKEAS
ncbi:MAG: mechanosensitive ion channel [Deltaproteobacteria bacterium]|nr:mechanosensitive ion channel [Deltaproteobacteria bacterium]